MQKTARALAVLLAASPAGVSGRALRHGRAAPAPAAANSDASASLDGFTVSFEIDNYDYFGLTDEWSNPWEDDNKEEPRKVKNTTVKHDGDKGSTASKAVDHVKDSLGNKHMTPFGDVKAVPPQLPWMEEKPGAKAVPPQLPWMEEEAARRAGAAARAQEAPVAGAWARAFVAQDMGAKKQDGKGGGATASGQTASFLQVGACWHKSDSLKQLLQDQGSQTSLTTMDALRTAITHAIENSIVCEKAALAAKSAKQAAAPAAAQAPAPAAAPTTAAPAPATAHWRANMKPSIHVTFRPGAKRPTASLLERGNRSGEPRMLNKPRASLIRARAVSTAHWSVIVDVTITDRPNNHASDLKEAKTHLRKALVSGQLEENLRNAMYEVTGDKADIRHVEVKPTAIKQWDVSKCEKHISNVVNMFTLQYTRAQVPMALYNECTNFMPKMSFSRDHILDSVDASRCRKATVAFEKHWKYGAHSSPKDFELMCIEACEAKYGDGAPLCHVSEGMDLEGQRS